MGVQLCQCRHYLMRYMLWMGSHVRPELVMQRVCPGAFNSHFLVQLFTKPLVLCLKEDRALLHFCESVAVQFNKLPDQRRGRTARNLCCLCGELTGGSEVARERHAQETIAYLKQTQNGRMSRRDQSVQWSTDSAVIH